MGKNQGKRIIGLVGERGVGKTSLILSLLERVQAKEIRVAGVVSPGIFEGDQKVAIELVDLLSKEGRLLARLAAEEEGGLRFGDWSFDEDALAWGNCKLELLTTSDLLIFDEIGPLELDFNQGLQAGLARLLEGRYKVGIVTLRPKCVKAIQRHFSDIELFYLTSIDDEALIETIFRVVIDSF